MISTNEFKTNVTVTIDGDAWQVVEFQHVKPGKGNTFMRTKLKDVVNGYVLERRFNIGEKLEDVRVERRPHQYLYMEGADYIFMNQETFDQIPIAHDLINGVDFLLEGMVVDVVSDASTETVLFADVPVWCRPLCCADLLYDSHLSLGGACTRWRLGARRYSGWFGAGGR